MPVAAAFFVGGMEVCPSGLLLNNPSLFNRKPDRINIGITLTKPLQNPYRTGDPIPIQVRDIFTRPSGFHPLHLRLILMAYPIDTC